jgi:peptidyl-prolyl cis-trans isomerase A (cyclophilin A)
MIRRSFLAFALLSLAAPGAMLSARPPAPVRVRIFTSLGPIVIALDRRAPLTCANFLRYVDAHRFDNTRVYRAARAEGKPTEGLVQGGIDHNMTLIFPPVKHEPSSQTGIHNVDGTVAMARNDPGTAMGDFFFVVGDGSYLDAAPGYPGYAAFAHVVSGMPVVKQMLALPTWPGGWSAETKGQSIKVPPKILTVRRVG